MLGSNSLFRTTKAAVVFGVSICGFAFPLDWHCQYFQTQVKESKKTYCDILPTTKTTAFWSPVLRGGIWGGGLFWHLLFSAIPALGHGEYPRRTEGCCSGWALPLGTAARRVPKNNDITSETQPPRSHMREEVSHIAGEILCVTRVPVGCPEQNRPGLSSPDRQPQARACRAAEGRIGGIPD